MITGPSWSFSPSGRFVVNYLMAKCWHVLPKVQIPLGGPDQTLTETRVADPGLRKLWSARLVEFKRNKITRDWRVGRARIGSAEAVRHDVLPESWNTGGSEFPPFRAARRLLKLRAVGCDVTRSKASRHVASITIRTAYIQLGEIERKNYAVGLPISFMLSS